MANESPSIEDVITKLAEDHPMARILEVLSQVCTIRMKSASDQVTKGNGPSLSDKDRYRITATELERAARRFHPER